MKNYSKSKLPYIDECRYLILKMIGQAICDYSNLSNSNAPIDQFYYESACQFLFDNNFIIHYGDTEKTLQDLLDILNLDICWFREHVVKLKDKKIREQKEKRDNDINICEDWELDLDNED